MHEEPVTQNEVSLREYFDLLRRRKAIIISTVIASVFIGFAAILISRPVYRSTGRLLFTPVNPMIRSPRSPTKQECTTFKHSWND
jgi:uncharacterized protein involved in exopolysaccharide biosynthesis